MGQYNLMFEQEEFTELVRLYSELAFLKKIKKILALFV